MLRAARLSYPLPYTHETHGSADHGGFGVTHGCVIYSSVISLGNVVLGYDSTAPVTLADIIHHARAARRGAPDTFLIADLPFGTYHTGVTDAMRNAVRVIQETGADALKVEGASPEVLEVIATLTRNGIPVMGHVGLTPQTASARRPRSRARHDAVAGGVVGDCP